MNAKKEDVTVEAAMFRARKAEGEMQYIVQVVASDWDKIVLADEVNRLRTILLESGKAI